MAASLDFPRKRFGSVDWCELVDRLATPQVGATGLGCSAQMTCGEQLLAKVASLLSGVEGDTLCGMALYRFDGEVWFDRFGTAPGGSGLLTLPSKIEPSVIASSGQPKSDGLLIRFREALNRAFARTHAGPPVSLSVHAPIRQSSLDPLVRYSLYTPELNLMAETEQTTASTPAIAYEYIWFAGQPVAQFDLATNTTHWTFTDHLGTPILQTNAAGSVDWRVEYEPYGNVATLRAGATRHQSLRFPGQEYDEALADRSYNIFRWYRGGWGRYTQNDPLTTEPRLYLRQKMPLPFSYAADSPMGNIDVTGLAACRTCGVCPNGVWTVDPFGWGLSGALIAGVTYTRATYTCRDNGFYVKIETTCTVGGLVLGAGASVTGPGRACGCSVGDLINNGDATRGNTFWIGPVPAYSCKRSDQTYSQFLTLI